MDTEKKERPEVREVTEEEMKKVCGGRVEDIDWRDSGTRRTRDYPYIGNE